MTSSQQPPSNNTQKKFSSLFEQTKNLIKNADLEHSFFKKGETVFREGTTALGLYCIQSGKFKLSITGDDGKEKIIHLVKEGDMMGYRALLSDSLYNASAVALESCELIFIPKDIFIEVLKANSQLSFEMMKLLADDLKDAEVQMTHLAQKPVRERMAEAILIMKDTYDFESDQQTLNVTLSREEIANLVGTATETAIRLLSEFRNDRIIELVGKKIKILDLPRLYKTANLPD
jgi:CRP/FNR family transcriptional regulator